MDTDLDGMTDGMEVHFGANPLVAAAGLPPIGDAVAARVGMGTTLGATLPAEPDPADLPDDDHALGLDAGARYALAGRPVSTPVILTEKLRRPEPAGLSRSRLEGPLLDSASSRLDLVVAPPGSGKTTLLARVAAAAATVPVAWYRVTADDTAEATLVAHLGRALRDTLGIEVPGFDDGFAARSPGGLDRHRRDADPRRPA